MPTSLAPRPVSLRHPCLSRLACLAAVPLAAAAWLAGAAGAATAASVTGDIAFHADTAYPEGIAYSARDHRFLVGSIHRGTIGRVGLEGRYSDFIRDPALVSSVGMFLDARRNILWVANGDVGHSVHSSPATLRKLAAVAAYDASSGVRIGYHDLGPLSPGAHFANDVTVDAAGNAYITDSFSPVIYRVDRSGRAVIFAQDARFSDAGFGLNGIVFHPDGYLLVNKNNSGELFRVNVGDPTRIDAVRLPEALRGADGMVLRAPGRITLVQNGDANRALELVSTDGWNSATIRSQHRSARSFPTTAAVAGRAVYFLNSRLDTLMTPGVARVSDYLLQKY